MKAMRLLATGAPLTACELTLPPPGPHEVAIRVEA